jgi:hypothetical protein
LIAERFHLTVKAHIPDIDPWQRFPMGFVLTLLYISLALLSPVNLVPSFAAYRIELMVALAALLFSAPGLLDSRFYRIPQIYLLAGLFAAVFLSVAIGNNWMGGGWIALQNFLPAAIVFYLIVMNCKSIGRLNILVTMLVVIAGVYVFQGSRAYLAGDISSPLLQVIPVSDGSVNFRMQGLGFLRDPNEFAQLLVLILPLLWLRWRQGLHFQNVLFVVVPTAFFVWGVYLTHSRGAVVALVVVSMLALKDRMRLGPAILGGALAFSILLALDFSGGREISFQAGSDRLALWGDGLHLFLRSPLFGIGFQGFAEQNSGHTAHNTFVVCLAELGIVGYAFWMGLLTFTLSGLNSLITSSKTDPAPGTFRDDNTESVDPENDNFEKWARALRISLAGFLAAAFFLSRAFVLPLYLILGMAVALLGVASEQTESIAPQPAWRMLFLTAKLGFAAIAVVYVSLQFRSVLF